MTNDPRPTKYTNDMYRAAAEKMADDLATIIPDMDRDQVINDLLSHRASWSDGYQLAKSLDDFSHWEIDYEMVEKLTYMDIYRHGQKEAAVKEWVERNRPAQLYQVGEEVTFTCPHDGDLTGPVHSVDEKEARYAVDHNRTGKGGRLVPFEDVRAA